MYNLQSLADFAAAAPDLHWREFMAGADIDESAMSELVVDAALLLHRGRRRC